MKLVTMTSECSKRFGDKQAIKMIKNAGFDGYDYSFFCDNAIKVLSDNGYKEYYRVIRQYSEEIGLPCLQTHAPCEYSLLDEKESEEYIRIALRSIESAAILGSKIVVVHPEKWLMAEENKKRIYDRLLPMAKKCNVVIAAENMYRLKDDTETVTVPGACGTAQDFVAQVDIINDANFVACMDIGHAEMVNSEGAVKIIMALGKRIGCLHVHDNDLFGDLHAFPFCGKINWKEVAKALKDVGYSGHFTFEADSFMKNYPDELIPACLYLLEKTGRYLMGLIEKN